MFWEKKLGHWANHVRNNVNLPLRVDLWDGSKFHLGHEAPQVIIHIPHIKSLSCLFVPSLSNLGSAYVEGLIDIEGTPGNIISIGNSLASGLLKPQGKFARLVRNSKVTREKNQKAIEYHYDVSNDFYKLWLDQNMVYSCAYFENGDESLDLAQLKKIDHILNKIQLRPGHTLLDIGCGWGALIMRAAEKYGARCVGVTLSRNQEALARKKVFEAGLNDRIEIRLQDYRDVEGSFDRITSVGMFEHVGIDNLPGYFRKIHSLLADDGVAMNHGITTTDVNNGESPFGNGEFVENYVFPHGQLPHLATVLKTMQEGGMEAWDIENLRRHYAATCQVWTNNFEANADKIRSLVGEKKFRIWRVYLAGCVYAFNQGWISLYQVVCFKHGNNPAIMPWSRRPIYETDPNDFYIRQLEDQIRVQIN